MSINPRLAELFSQLLPQDTPKIITPSTQIVVPAYDDDFDIVRLMKDAKDPDTGLLRDLKIDDRDLASAANFYDYSLNILKGDAHPPWIMQMWVGLMTYGELCVSKGTYVQTNHGLKKIETLCDTAFGEIKTGRFTTTALTGNNKVTHAGFTSHDAKVYEVRCTGELPVQATADHKFLVLTSQLDLEWVKLRNLRKGDYLVSKVGSNLWPEFPAKLKTDYRFQKSKLHLQHEPADHFKPLATVTNELARLIGYLITDGYINDQGIGYSNTDIGLLKDFTECANAVFALPFKVLDKVFSVVYDGSLYKTIKFPKYTYEYLESIGFGVGICYTKCLPEFILESSSDIVCQCLQAMFDSDGFIDSFGGHERIGLSITSKIAVEQVFLLLKNLGIESNYREIPAEQSDLAKRHNQSGFKYELTIRRGESLALYAKLIGSKHAKKKENLKLFAKKVHHRFAVKDSLKIPKGFIPWHNYDDLLSLLDPAGQQVNAIGKLARKELRGFKDYFPYRTFPKAISGKKLLETPRIVRFLCRNEKRLLLLNKIRKLVALNLSFSPVYSIKNAGTTEVYDLRVPDSESFLANGILVHNCPPCSDKRWFDLQWVIDHVDKAKPSEEIVEGFQLLHHGVCQKCKRTKTELITNHGLNNYTELVNILGQRSGKSSSAATYSSYHTHRMLKFPRLAELTSAMQKSTELTATFVSLTFDKAESLLWTPYRNIVDESSWFNEYHKMLDHYSEKYGVELYRKKDLFHKYFHKGLKLYPSGPKSQTLRGDTRYLSIIDELALFPLPTGNDEEDEKSDRANADEAHKSLTNSLTTIQAVQLDLLAKGMNCPPALMLGVSSPISMRDKVMRRLADSRTPEGKKFILGVNLPTWKVNPYIHRNTPIITLAYASNAEKAERDFGANPPRVHQTFIKPSQVPYESFSVKNSHSLRYQYDQAGLLYAKVDKFYSPKFPSVVCIDAGAVNNSFTLIGAHFDFNTQKTVVTTCLEIMPHDNRRIDFDLVYRNVILPVLKDLHAVVLLADQWQSLDILSRATQDLGLAPISGKEKPRCLSKQHSPRRKDFDSLIAMVENKALLLPWLAKTDYEQVVTDYLDYRTLNGQPVKHLFLQMLTVKDVGEGKCPEKGEGFTDDIFRALVLSTLIHHEKIMTRLHEAQAWMVEKGHHSMPIPAFRPRML